MKSPITVPLREALIRSGMTDYRAAKEIGASVWLVTRFKRGGHLTTASADRLAALLGLALVKRPERKGAK